MLIKTIKLNTGNVATGNVQRLSLSWSEQGFSLHS